MIARALTACLDGIQVHVVEVEADIGVGLPAFHIVGLTDKTVQEARERVRSALRNSGFGFPSHRLTVNLAPAQLRKEGSAFDLAIAVAVLRCSGHPLAGADGSGFVGELGLDGSVRPVRGVLALSNHLTEAGAVRIFVPTANADEATAAGVTVHPVESLTHLVAHLEGEELIPAYRGGPDGELPPGPAGLDLLDIQGQDLAKRALEVAAAGGHHVLFTGPPGAGKSMLARAFAGLLPDLAAAESKEVTSIHSVAGLLRGPGLLRRPPLRSPHHSISIAGMIGGGATFSPGELTLAHRGVLVLDELPEFHRDCLEALRQPLEEGLMRLRRASGNRVLPARFILAATANPCPCGVAPMVGRRRRGRDAVVVPECVCPPDLVARYQRRLSGPLRDRVDLVVEVRPVVLSRLAVQSSGEGSALVRERVLAARQRQAARGQLNSDLLPRDLSRACPLEADAERLLSGISRQYNLSGRGFHGVLRVARSLADLDARERITGDHLLEACEYRAA